MPGAADIYTLSLHDALPISYRNLGYLLSGRRCRVCAKYGGPHREGDGTEQMRNGDKRPDLVRAADKTANKAEQPTAEASTGASAAEPVERRAGTKGNAGQQSTCRAQNRISVSQALERLRQFAVTHPRWEPYAGKPHVRFCAGGVR